MKETGKSYFVKSDYSELWTTDLKKGGQKAPTHILKSIEKIQSKKTILEIGSGNGNILTLLSKKDSNTVGLDLSIQLLDASRKRSDISRKNTHLICGDGMALPLREKSVSDVLCIQTSWYILDLEKLLFEVKFIQEDMGLFICDYILPDVSTRIRDGIEIFINKSIQLKLSTHFLQILISCSAFMNKFVKYSPGKGPYFRLLDKGWLRSAFIFGLPPIRTRNVQTIIQTYIKTDLRIRNLKVHSKNFITIISKN